MREALSPALKTVVDALAKKPPIIVQRKPLYQQYPYIAAMLAPLGRDGLALKRRGK
jgi:hypothetical protein